jgi:PKD repeat protein
LTPFTDDWAALAGDGNAVIMWNEPNGELQAALKPSASPRWSAPIHVNSDYNLNDCCADLTLGDNGRATAIWEPGPELPPSGKDIVAANLAGGPVITLLDSTPHVQVPTRTHFSVSAFGWSAPLAGKPRWTFGDGTSATGTKVTHTYLRPGNYTVTATARDAAGGTTSQSKIVHVTKRNR